MKKLMTAIMAGAILEYFLDPDHGTRRRNVTRDRIGGMARRYTKQANRYVAGTTQGLQAKMTSHPHDNPDQVDNKTLKDRVESEVLRNPKFSRAPINFNVEEDSVVVIHGELPHPEDIDQLINEVKAVRGVKKVVSYLHLPNTPAPNKLSAIIVD
ncbi:MAG TPA: BON domain-containing protein [Chloroflexota bacterium]|nr:BON domain-containing protein [Chloroflexota bacterium]